MGCIATETIPGILTPASGHACKLAMFVGPSWEQALMLEAVNRQV